MKTNYLIYYVLKLITKGQEWQYKNLNGKGDRPKLYFTQLQLIALLISILFVYTKPKGLSNEMINYVLSSLSIMTALFLSLIIIIFDKFNNFNFKGEGDDEKIHKFLIEYLQLIIPQYFISNKSGIWSLSLIVHSKG